MTAVLEIKNLTKTYGHNRGVSNISLELEPGTIVGFLGPNGAGKTTTISMLVDLIRPNSGSITAFGLDVKKNGVAVRQRIGFLAGDFALDESLTGWQQLEYFGNLRGHFDRNYVKQLAKRLDTNLNRRIKTLSRGNRQKVGLISALMHQPELLIFDEPTSGLDPIIQAEFNKIILEHKAAGKTAFISSHALSEVQEICDQVAFIREGKLVAVEAVSELRAKSPKQVRVQGADAKLKQAIKALKGVHAQAGETSFNFTFTGDINQLLKLLSKHQVVDVQIQEADLEAVFMKYYEGHHV